VALSVEVLRALAAPATVDELARRLEVPEAHLHRELERLERRGYVRRLACGPNVRPASLGACGWCALKATCDATASERWLRA
jgi:DNA-binding IclR family transcriptional regulator